MDSFVTFIIPVYNCADTIAACLDSILAQNYEPMEIITINDGSTDGSDHILENYESKYGNIIVHNQRNQGVSAARNKGISMAKGDYISFVDGDDLITPDFLNSLLPYSCHGDIIVGGRATYVNGVYTKSKCAPEVKFDDTITAAKRFLLGQYGAHTAWGKLYKKSIIEQIAFPENRIFEDIYFSLDSILASQHIVFVNKELYLYQIRQGSIITSKYDLQIKDYTAAALYVHQALSERNILDRCMNEFKIFLARGIVRNNRLYSKSSLIDEATFKRYSTTLIDLYESIGGLDLYIPNGQI